MQKQPRKTGHRPAIDWATLIVTGWIVVTGAVLTGSILSTYVWR